MSWRSLARAGAPDFAQRCLGSFARPYVVEQNGDLALLCLANAEGVHLVPTAECIRPVLEPLRNSRPGDPSIDIDPILLMRRRQLPHPSPDCVDKPGLCFEGRVDLGKPVVNW